MEPARQSVSSSPVPWLIYSHKKILETHYHIARTKVIHNYLFQQLVSGIIICLVMIEILVKQDPGSFYNDKSND